MPEKTWLHKTVGNKGWLMTTDKGAEFIETKTKLLEKLKELGLSGNRQYRRLNRAKNSPKAKYRVEIKKNGITLFEVSGVSEETMWALCDLAETFYRQVLFGSLFTEIRISRD
jgi:hypothetical protein